jgi:predicted 3-demethylubiquinone-9 3-methyltransferase (glyoxalase superfamily)
LSEEVPGPKGKALMASFQLAGDEFMALNGGPVFNFTPATSLFVTCQTKAEIDALWQKLCEGGTVLMEMAKYPFSEAFGWVNDRYHVSWQLNLAGSPQKVTPFLLFVGEQAGKAAEAVQFYTSVFKESNVIRIERYGAGEGGQEGTVKHASFSLNGLGFIAMDSSLEHAFTFTPAISFYVNCQDQAEVDYFWETLSKGGEESQCGWLKDRYGVSWQIVPTILGELMNDPDAEKANRVTQAMLKMGKLDIEKLKEAYNQV